MSKHLFYTVGCVQCGDFYRTESEARAEKVLRQMKKDRDMWGRSIDHSHDGLVVVQQNRKKLTR